MPALFNQHGKGRKQPPLDKLFGVKHTGNETASNFFASKLWVETDQDKAFSYKTYQQLFDTHPPQKLTPKRLSQQPYAIANNNLPIINSRAIGKGNAPKGRAILLNFSPQRYLQYRQQNKTSPQTRAPFINHILNADIKPFAKITHNNKPLEKAELTYWTNNNRLYIFVVQNVPMNSSSLGGGGADNLQTNEIDITLQFNQTMKNGINERTNQKLPNQTKFNFKWNRVEALLLSFDL